MKFLETPIPGAYLVHMDLQEDERGFFARTWCASELASLGLNPQIAQCSVSFNRYSGTLRGMHYQQAPHEEAKLVRCTRGALFDVIVDARAKASTEGKHFGVTLRAEDTAMLYIPEGVAHGFETLVDDTEVSYWISAPHEPTAQRGFKWDDPRVGINWPLTPRRISARDAALPPFGLRQTG